MGTIAQLENDIDILRYAVENIRFTCKLNVAEFDCKIADSFMQSLEDILRDTLQTEITALQARLDYYESEQVRASDKQDYREAIR